MDWGEVLCRVGLHRWECGTTTDASERPGIAIVRDWNWCLRPRCRYASPMMVNVERVPVPSYDREPAA